MSKLQKKKPKSEIASESSTVEKSLEIPQMLPFQRLGREFFDQPCVDLAKALLGKILVRRVTSADSSASILMTGRIVETESYLGGEDRGSCSYNDRKTDHNVAMFMDPGTCFVYMTYGMYHCFNISSRGDGAAVLLRSLEPTSGVEFMRENRQKAKKRKLDSSDVAPKLLKVSEICNGPSKLCMAMNITKQLFNKADLTISEEMFVADDGFGVVDESNVVSCARIGINKAGEWNTKPLRFYIRSSDFISVKV